MIVISPYSKKLGNGKRNPKDYPWWPEVIGRLRGQGFQDIIQIGIKGEEAIGVDRMIFNGPFYELAEIIKESLAWASVDNFLPHFCRVCAPNKPGVVIFSQSDPEIFGYQENINLLKDDKYLREKQFDLWTHAEFIEEAFVEPERVVNAIVQIAGDKR